MTEPFLRDDELLAQIERWRAREPENVIIWSLGRCGFLLCHQNRTVLLDPCLPPGPVAETEAETPFPPPPRIVDPALLKAIDFITVSHAHPGHLDIPTLGALAEANPQAHVICPTAHRQILADATGLADHLIHALDSEQSARVSGMHFYGVASAHNELETDVQGNHLFLGFVIDWAAFTFYHSGDTLDYPGLDNRLRWHEIDLAFLPISGANPDPNATGGNMWGREAAALARRSSLNRVIPCHYGPSARNQVTTAEFTATCERLRQPYFLVDAGQAALLRDDGSCRMLLPEE